MVYSQTTRSLQLLAHRITIPDDSLATLSDSERGQSGFFYIPNFITEEEKQYLVQKILSSPQPKWKSLQNRRLQYWGGQVSNTNILIPQTMPNFLQEYPNLMSRLQQTAAFPDSKHGKPNYCLVNEYLPGQGIMPYEDGNAYYPAVATISLGSHTLLDIYRYVDDQLEQKFDEQMQRLDQSKSTTTEEEARAEAEGKRTWSQMDGGAVPRERIEEGVKIVRGARARQPEPVFSILQEPRSLLITTGSMYKEYLHGIAERSIDGPRALAKVVNTSMIQDEQTRTMVEKAKANSADQEAELKRKTRLSLFEM